jgi:hypothetical protein
MVAGVTLQYNASKLYKYDTKLSSFISNCVTSDRVNIYFQYLIDLNIIISIFYSKAFVCMSGMRCVAYLIEDQVKNSLKLETDLAVLLAKVKKLTKIRGNLIILYLSL